MRKQINDGENKNSTSIHCTNANNNNRNNPFYRSFCLQTEIILFSANVEKMNNCITVVVLMTVAKFHGHG